MKKYERITAIITSLGGVWIMYYAWHTLKLGSIHIPDAGLLPFLCGVGLVLLGIVWILILQWKRESENEGPAEKRLWHRPLFSLVLMVLYGWAMEKPLRRPVKISMGSAPLSCKKFRGDGHL